MKIRLDADSVVALEKLAGKEHVKRVHQCEDAENIKRIIAVDDAERVRKMIDREKAAVSSYASWTCASVRVGNEHAAKSDAMELAEHAHRIMLLRVLLEMVDTTGKAGIVIEDGKVKE